MFCVLSSFVIIFSSPFCSSTKIYNIKYNMFFLVWAIFLVWSGLFFALDPSKQLFAHFSNLSSCSRRLGLIGFRGISKCISNCMTRTTKKPQNSQRLPRPVVTNNFKVFNPNSFYIPRRSNCSSSCPH